MIFLNLVPMLELDGYWILSDFIQVPDLRPRSLQFIRYDVWHKLRRRERFTKQEVGLGLYAVLGVAFTILSLYWSVVFWQEVFGGLIEALWNGGPITRVLLVAPGALRARSDPARPHHARSLGYRKVLGVVQAVRFRFQTKWRVEAAELIDALPIFEDLPEDILSDLAGRVQLRSFPAGKSVFRQGDRPDAFYVVRQGVLHVIEEDLDTGKERVLAPSAGGSRSASSVWWTGRPGPRPFAPSSTPSCSRSTRPRSTGSCRTRSTCRSSRRPSSTPPSSGRSRPSPPWGPTTSPRCSSTVTG